MIPINVIKLIISSFFVFSLCKVSSQAIKKENIYVLFTTNDGLQPKFRGKKFVNSNGINFNLLKKGAFLHEKEMKKDTLYIDKLKNYLLTDVNDIEKKAKKWRVKNEEKLKKKYSILYRQASEAKNNVFNVYIIEKINSNQIVLYEVKFRNEGVVD